VVEDILYTRCRRESLLQRIRFTSMMGMRDAALSTECVWAVGRGGAASASFDSLQCLLSLALHLSFAGIIVSIVIGGGVLKRAVGRRWNSCETLG